MIAASLLLAQGAQAAEHVPALSVADCVERAERFPAQFTGLLQDCLGYEVSTPRAIAGLAFTHRLAAVTQVVRREIRERVVFQAAREADPMFAGRLSAWLDDPQWREQAAELGAVLWRPGERARVHERLLRDDAIARDIAVAIAGFAEPGELTTDVVEGAWRAYLDARRAPLDEDSFGGLWEAMQKQQREFEPRIRALIQRGVLTQDLAPADFQIYARYAESSPRAREELEALSLSDELDVAGAAIPFSRQALTRFVSFEDSAAYPVPHAERWRRVLLHALDLGTPWRRDALSMLVSVFRGASPEQVTSLAHIADSLPTFERSLAAQSLTLAADESRLARATLRHLLFDAPSAERDAIVAGIAWNTASHATTELLLEWYASLPEQAVLRERAASISAGNRLRTTFPGVPFVFLPRLCGTGYSIEQEESRNRALFGAPPEPAEKSPWKMLEWEHTPYDAEILQGWRTVVGIAEARRQRR